MIRRFGERVVQGRKYMHRPGIYAVLLQEQEVLLTYQADPNFEYQLPGGGIDPGEQPLAALHREVLEETGWTLANPRRLGAFRRFAYMPEYDLWAEKVGHIYLARPGRCLGAPTEPGHSAVWAPIEVAVEVLANESDRHCLKQVIRYGASGIRA